MKLNSFWSSFNYLRENLFIFLFLKYCRNLWANDFDYWLFEFMLTNMWSTFFVSFHFATASSKALSFNTDGFLIAIYFNVSSVQVPIFCFTYSKMFLILKSSLKISFAILTVPFLGALTFFSYVGVSSKMFVFFTMLSMSYWIFLMRETSWTVYLFTNSMISFSIYGEVSNTTFSCFLIFFTNFYPSVFKASY